MTIKRKKIGKLDSFLMSLFSGKRAGCKEENPAGGHNNSFLALPPVAMHAEREGTFRVTN